MEMTTKVRLPRCCGHEMKFQLDLGKFLEVRCDTCRDVAYIKKYAISRTRAMEE